MTVHVADRFKVANAFRVGLSRIGLTPAAVLRQARVPASVYAKKNLVTTAQFFALWCAAAELSSGTAGNNESTTRERP